MASTQPSQMGGLEALVAAASAAGHTPHLPNGQISNNLIDPSLQNMSDTTQALDQLLNDPAFAAAVQDYSLRPTSLYTQLLTNMLPFGIPNTPVQQTRSGRISRPPLIPPQHPVLQTQGGSIMYSSPGRARPGNVGAGQGEQEDSGRLLRPDGEAGNEKHARPSSRKFVVLSEKRRPSIMEADDNDTSSTGTVTPQPSGGERGMTSLPPYPLPPTGPNSRKMMPRDELIARRRARNRVAAIESRKKKKEFMDGLEDRLKEREDAYDELERHCQALEQEVLQLRGVLAGAGLLPPGVLPAAVILPQFDHPLNSMLNCGGADTLMSRMPRPSTQTLPKIRPLSPAIEASPLTDNIGETPMTIDATPIPTFDMFFNLDDDMDGEHDADFLPTSSPKHDSSGESDADEKRSISRKRKSRKGKRKVHVKEEDEDEDFVDPEVEDEDLFLPIEDVPIPEGLKQDAMRSLGVDNQAQLVNLINKMVNAGQEGMTPETVEKLKVLLRLVGPKGGWSG